VRTDKTTDWLVGRQLGDFVLRERIGQGGFATVYKCDQPLLGREAVVKVLHARLSASDIVLQRFMREARLASRLDHPYAAHVYAFGVERDDGLAWIAMELVHGTSLESWIVERGPLPLDMLVTFFEQVAEVVQNAHDHGIVHRDLKPSNVMMVGYTGRIFPKLLDFGIAKMLGGSVPIGSSPALAIDLEDSLEIDGSVMSAMAASDSGGHNLTQANTTLGSPPYMSPEQWSDPLSVGPRSDLYSLGVMAYEALTGRQPFVGPTIAAIAEQHLNAPVPPVGAGFPEGLDKVFQRVLAKDPEGRPASVLEFTSELRAAAAAARSREKTEEVPPLPKTEMVLPIVVAPRRKTWPLAIGAALTAAAAAAATAAFVLSGSGGDRAPQAAPAPAVAPAPSSPAPAPPDPAPAVGAPAAAAPATVVVEIATTPRGADVYRLPSETKVGATPWRAELPSEAGTQVFVVRKAGYADRRVEVDLRTGGTHAVKLSRATGRSTSPSSSGTGTGAGRRRGEPVDPFKKQSGGK
jgi:serine/threonine-protein kinase